jgi:polar amino acid transport system substrate-binding protein
MEAVMHKSVVSTILAVILAVAICAPAPAADVSRQLSQESVIETILERGVMRVGMDTFEPWAMKDKTGKFIGFEIDVARRLAEDMGVELELVPTKWSGIIPALLSGKFDVLIGGMSIRPDRALKVNFTIPYYFSGQDIVAHKELAAGFDELSDFNDSEVTIAARTGTTAASAAKKLFPEARIVLFDSEPLALQELMNRRAHAWVSMAPKPAFEAARREQLIKPFQGVITQEPNGFAVRKGDIDALNYFNSWIRVVRAEGWIDERYHYWFETREWEDQVQ